MIFFKYEFTKHPSGPALDHMQNLSMHACSHAILAQLFIIIFGMWFVVNCSYRDINHKVNDKQIINPRIIVTMVIIYGCVQCGTVWD